MVRIRSIDQPKPAMPLSITDTCGQNEDFHRPRRTVKCGAFSNSIAPRLLVAASPSGAIADIAVRAPHFLFLFWNKPRQILGQFRRRPLRSSRQVSPSNRRSGPHQSAAFAAPNKPFLPEKPSNEIMSAEAGSVSSACIEVRVYDSASNRRTGPRTKPDQGREFDDFHITRPMPS